MVYKLTYTGRFSMFRVEMYRADIGYSKCLLEGFGKETPYNITNRNSGIVFS